jgi:trehalose synthase
VTQISRFDRWKDPLGVIEAYRIARESVPSLQLALVGSMALDDPEGSEMYRQVCAATRDDPLVHIFTNLTGVSNIEVNAFQRLSDVIVQKSLREGFGLVVSEALWKGTPVVAGRAGGIPLQMADGAGGVLVDSVAECGAAIVRLLEDADAARALGASGRERVRHRFLLPRLLLDFMRLLAGLGGAQRQPAAQAAQAPRDPVCGMTVEHGELTLAHAGQTYHFCSEECRRRFAGNPQRYLVAAKP